MSWQFHWRLLWDRGGPLLLRPMSEQREVPQSRGGIHLWVPTRFYRSVSGNPSNQPTIHPSNHLSIYLSICLSVCLSVCLSIYPLSIHPSFYLSVYKSVCSSIHPSIWLSVCPCVHPSVHLSFKIRKWMQISTAFLNSGLNGTHFNAQFIIGQLKMARKLIPHLSNQIKSNHFYCLITTAQVPWWVKFLRACSRQCKKISFYIWTVHIYRLYRRQCAKYTYIYSVHIVYYKDILINYTLYTVCTHLHYVHYLYIM